MIENKFVPRIASAAGLALLQPGAGAPRAQAGRAAACAHVANTGWKYGVDPRRLPTFALDAQAPLVTFPPDLTVKALDDRAVPLDQADIGHGNQPYRRCVSCRIWSCIHGEARKGASGR